MSAKKIEGYGNEATESWSANHPTGSRATWIPATLVIHSGEPEPVYTQSEVVAMLREMEEDYHTEASRQQFYAIAAAYGITL